MDETGSKPAPGDLALVQAFVNTVDLESGEDAIQDADLLGAWLRSHGLAAGGRLGESEHARAVAVREAIRALALANHGDGDPAEGAGELDRVAADLRLGVRFGPDGRARLVPVGGGVDAALARLMGIVYTAMAEGTWDRFKACARDSCRWAFYDRSKNRSGNWCTMSVCGNREKAKAYRRRRSEAGS